MRKKYFLLALVTMLSPLLASSSPIKAIERTEASKRASDSYFVENGIRYHLTTTGTNLSGFNTVLSVASNPDEKYSGDIVIPSSAKGYDVSHIDGDAFVGCTELKSIQLPNSLNDVAGQAFYGCTNLEKITMNGRGLLSSPDGSNCILANVVNWITSANEDHLLLGCKNTVIPSSVKEISSYSFSGCTGLDSITIPSLVSVVTTALIPVASPAFTVIPKVLEYISSLCVCGTVF